MEPQKQMSLTGLNDKRDADLLRLYAEQHSEEAFASLGRRYAGLVYTTCLRELGEQIEAEDAAQAVFLLLSQKAASLHRYETIAGWLYTASCYTCRNVRRQQHRRKAMEGNAAVPEIPAPADAGNELWERIEPHFHNALNRLKPVDREAILLRYVQEFSLIEVGTYLGLSENTARMRVNRAMEKIRAHLAKAGIVIGLSALSAVVKNNSVQAAPPGVFSAVARIAALKAVSPPAKPVSIRFPFPKPMPASLSAYIGAACGLAVVGGGTWWYFLPHRITTAEQPKIFAPLSGNWQGTITFADDRTRKRYTYPTRVRVTFGDDGRTLQFTSSYVGSPQVDTLRFTGDPGTGLFSVRNGGAQASHNLGAVGAMTQERSGTITFRGNSSANQSEVRIQIIQSGSRLGLREEYRPLSPVPLVTAFSRYEFRNQYSLQRAL